MTDTRSALRRRSILTLIATVALGSTGHIAAVTIATIVAQEITGSPALAGAAVASLGSGVIVAWAGYAALGILGTTLVLVPAAAVLGRRGRMTVSPTSTP